MERIHGLKDTYYQSPLKMKQITWTVVFLFKEIKFVVRNVPLKAGTGPEGFTGAFYRTFKGETIQILPERRKCVPNFLPVIRSKVRFLLSSLYIIPEVLISAVTQGKKRNSILETVVCKWLYLWVILSSLWKM